jgi:hypothetical protein
MAVGWVGGSGCCAIKYHTIKSKATRNQTGGRGVAEASRKKRVSQYHCKYQEKLEGKKKGGIRSIQGSGEKKNEIRGKK